MLEYTVKVFDNFDGVLNPRYEWRLDGALHREDGPAIEYGDGGGSWWLNGRLHRVGGPAIEHADGHKAWYQNGKIHRADGPAVERTDGRVEWWLNGEEVSEEDVMGSKTKEVLPEVLVINGVEYRRN